MPMQDTIYVNEFTSPLITKQLLAFRNDSLISNSGTSMSQNLVNITGYTFQLVIKRTPVGIRVQDGYPQTYDSDAYALKYTGTLLNARTGQVQFQLDLAATCCYGNYAAEIRWWSGADTTVPPTDRVSMGFVVQRAVTSGGL